MPKVLIDMPDSFIKEHIESYEPGSLVDIAVRNALKHGIVLAGLTNGEVIQMLFPNTELHWTNEYEYGLRPLDSNWIIWFKGDWWNRKWGE